MDKTKFAILVGLLLALLFFYSMDVAAASTSYPSYKYDELSSGDVPAFDTTYFIKIGSDGVIVDSNGFSYFYAAGSDVITFDTGVISSVSTFLSSYSLYDYMVLECTPKFAFDFSNEFYNGSCVKVVDFMPYVIVRGTKYYLTNNFYNSLKISEPSTDWVNLQYGAEVTIHLSYDLDYETSIDSNGVMGYSNLNISFAQIPYYLYGFRYISTGESAIVDSVNDVNSTLGSISTTISDIISRFDISLSTLRNSLSTYIESLGTTIVNKMSNWQISLSLQMSSWQSALDSKLDEIKSLLSEEYDSSDAEDTNSNLSGSLDSWEAAEGATMDDAKVEVSNYDTSSAFNFAPALVSSLSLVTAFSTGFLNASGDFTTAITVMFSLVFVSVLVGLVRFVRR